MDSLKIEQLYWRLKDSDLGKDGGMVLSDEHREREIIKHLSNHLLLGKKQDLFPGDEEREYSPVVGEQEYSPVDGKQEQSPGDVDEEQLRLAIAMSMQDAQSGAAANHQFDQDLIEATALSLQNGATKDASEEDSSKEHISAEAISLQQAAMEDAQSGAAANHQFDQDLIEATALSLQNGATKDASEEDLSMKYRTDLLEDILLSLQASTKDDQVDDQSDLMNAIEKSLRDRCRVAAEKRSMNWRTRRGGGR